MLGHQRGTWSISKDGERSGGSALLMHLNELFSRVSQKCPYGKEKKQKKRASLSQTPSGRDKTDYYEMDYYEIIMRLL